MVRCATIDVTSECPLDCDHCYLSAAPRPAPLETGAWLQRLRALAANSGVRAVLWAGGEPLLERERLRRALPLFPRNAVVTSGAVPIPGDLDAGLIVSLDGLEQAHDALRGGGAFALALRHLAPLASRSFVLNVTLTRPTLSAAAELPRLVERTRAAGAVVGFFTGPPDSPLYVPSLQREQTIDALLRLPRDVLLTPEAALSLLRARSGLSRACPYRARDLALDAALAPRLPCTFGSNANCEACGCALIALRVAAERGDRESRAALEMVFPRSPSWGQEGMNA